MIVDASEFKHGEGAFDLDYDLLIIGIVDESNYTILLIAANVVWDIVYDIICSYFTFRSGKC